MTQAIERGRAEHLVGGKRIAPFAELEVAGQERGGLFVAFGDEFMEIFILRWTQGLEGEVVNDEDVHTGEILQTTGKAAGGVRAVERGQQLGLGGEQHVVAAGLSLLPGTFPGTQTGGVTWRKLNLQFVRNSGASHWMA